MNIETVISGLDNVAHIGAEGAEAAFNAVKILDRVPAPVYPEESSSVKERAFEDRFLLRALAARALAGRTSDSTLADAVAVLNRIITADENGTLADVPYEHARVIKTCLTMASLLATGAPEVIVQHQKSVVLRMLDNLRG